MTPERKRALISAASIVAVGDLWCGSESAPELARELIASEAEKDRMRQALESIFLLDKCPSPGDGCSQCISRAALAGTQPQPCTAPLVTPEREQKMKAAIDKHTAATSKIESDLAVKLTALHSEDLRKFRELLAEKQGEIDRLQEALFRANRRLTGYVRGVLESARSAMQSAWYELDPGEAAPGDQFIRQADMQRRIDELSAALSGSQADPKPTEFPVYFDMDGVLANFDEAYDRLIGERLPNGDVIWERVNAIGDFFAQLQPMPGMMALWECVPADRRRILSSIPKSIEISGDHKREWLKRHLNIEGDDVVLVRGKKLKKQYARPGHILVDDWPSNVRDWENVGGIGILYLNHERALSELRNALETAAPAEPAQAEPDAVEKEGKS